MSKDSNNQSRRKFLKKLGIGSVSMIGLIAVEPFKAVAFRQDDKKVPVGASADNKMTYRVNRHTNDKVSLLGYGMTPLPVGLSAGLVRIRMCSQHYRA